jgi:thiamine transport system substrate-binding protein
MKLSTLLLMAVLLAAPLSGCLERSESNDECTVLPAGHDDDGVLRILTYDITALSEELTDEFTNQTGIAVEMIKVDDAGGILDQMMLTKNAQQADLMIGLDNTYLPTAIANCLLQANEATPENISDSASAFYEGPLAVPFDQGDVCLNYDEDALEEANMSVPTHLSNLTQEEWKGKVAFPSPVTSSPGRAFLVASMDYFSQDESGDAMAWWSDMIDNDAIITTGWTEAYETHYTGGYGEYTEGYIGDAWMTVSYCHSPGVEAFYADNYTHSTSLMLEHSHFHQVEYTGIINGAAQVTGANLFIDYLLSSQVNTNMPENNLMYSVLEGTDLPETNGYRHHADLPAATTTMTYEEIETNMDSWLEEWKAATQQA